MTILGESAANERGTKEKKRKGIILRPSDPPMKINGYIRKYKSTREQDIDRIYRIDCVDLIDSIDCVDCQTVDSYKL